MALALTLLATSCTSEEPRSPDVPFVAFRDLPDPTRAPQEQPGRPTPVPPPGTPDCQPDQVAITVEDASVPSQPVLSSLRLTATHVRGPACAVREGHTPVMALDAAGDDLGVDSLPAGERSLSGAALLPPGATTHAFLTWQRSDCATPLAAVRLPIAPGGQPSTALAVPDPPCLTPATPITVKAWGHPFTVAVQPPPSPVPPWSVLTARLLPLTGDDRVVVRLRNPTQEPVALEPCPAYRAGVRDEPADEVIAQVTESLDCEQAPAVLAPGGEVDLEIELGPLPPGRELRAAPDLQQADGTLSFGLKGYGLRQDYADTKLDLLLRRPPAG